MNVIHKINTIDPDHNRSSQKFGKRNYLQSFVFQTGQYQINLSQKAFRVIATFGWIS